MVCRLLLGSSNETTKLTHKRRKHGKTVLSEKLHASHRPIHPIPRGCPGKMRRTHAPRLASLTDWRHLREALAALEVVLARHQGLAVRRERHAVGDLRLA